MTSVSVARQASLEMDYIDQAPADLRLFLVDGPIELEQFTILQETTVEWAGHAVRLGIIGESHFAQVRGAEGDLTEICACVSLRLDAGATVLSDRVPEKIDAPVRVRAGADDYVCEVDYLVGRRAAAALGELLAEADARVAAAPATTHKLHLEFPEEQPGLPVPQTLVLAECGDELVVRSAHSYPNHDTVVLTRSRLVRPAAGPRRPAPGQE